MYRHSLKGNSSIFVQESIKAGDAESIKPCNSPTAAKTIGMINELVRRGVRVPEDVAVTGHAGEKITQYFLPSITTGEKAVEEIARKSMERLLYRISNKSDKAPFELKLPSLLVERDSSARILVSE